MTFLLARTADRLLWGARYLERAEDTARVVRAYSDLVFDYSDELLSWEPLAALPEIWAEVMPQTAREFVLAKQVNAELTHLLRIRYTRELKVTHRLRFKNFPERVLDINGISDPGERHAEMLVQCREARIRG